MSRALRRPGLILLGFAIALLGAFAIRGVVGSRGPARVSEVPATLPSGGVNVNGQIILEPLTTPPAGALSKAAVISVARRNAVTKRRFPATALEASVTIPGSNLRDVPAWIVTFTRSDAASAQKNLAKHLSVVLDVTTGKPRFGFYTN